MSTDELLAETLRLSRRERARVAEELLSSLEEPEDDVAAAWRRSCAGALAKSPMASCRRSRGMSHAARFGRNSSSVVRVELHPDARSELRLAALWYEERRAGLGDRFVDCVDAAFARLAQFPEAHPIWTNTAQSAMPIRKAGIVEFPYLVAFEVHPAHVLVLAIAHGKRRPLALALTSGSAGPAERRGRAAGRHGFGRQPKLTSAVILVSWPKIP